MEEYGRHIQILDLDGYMSTVQYDPLKHIDAEEDAKKNRRLHHKQCIG